MEFDEIVIKGSPGLCRCCLSEGCYKDLSTEYTWMDDNEVYAEMLLECFDISISQHNEGPNGPNRLICEVCITRLRDACNFKKQVLASEKKFVDMVGRGAFKSKVVVYQAPIKVETAIEESHEAEEAEVEYLEDDMDFGDGDLLKDDDAIDQSLAEDITVETLPVKGKRGRPRKNALAVQPEKRVKLTKTEEKSKTSKAIAKDETPPSTGDPTSERRRRNLQILFNNTSILPFKWRGKYLCFYCGKSCASYDELGLHTRSHRPCSTKDYSLKLIKGNNIEVKVDVSKITCDICAKVFDKLHDVIDHLIENHDMVYDKRIETPIMEYRLADLRCLYCKQSLPHFANLIRHVNNMHPTNSFVCTECGASCNKMRDLALHLRRNHHPDGYPCGECSIKFPSLNLLRAHRNDFHFRKCMRCDSKFPSHRLLVKHMKCEHPDDGKTKCHLCLKQFHSPLGLNQHMNKCKLTKANRSETNITKDGLLQPIKKRNILQIRKNIQCVLNMSNATPFKFFVKFCCFYCSRKFDEMDELKGHTVTEHPVCDLKSKYMERCKGERITVKLDVNNLECRVCRQPMVDLEMLIDHLIENHDADYDKSVTECLEPYKMIKDNMPCPSCPDRTFRYFSTLLRHINSEHSNNNRICNFCGKSFKKDGNLSVHIAYAHMGSSECKPCGIQFKNQWCLNRHKARMHDARDYKCPKCPELFPSQYHKQKHLIKVHDTGFKCSHCGKMFTRNSFMKDHIRRTHLKEKNVVCSVCNERFFDNYLLKLHMVKHDGERKYICDVCGKAFLRSSNLNSHKGVHKKYGAYMSAVEDKCKRDEMARKLSIKRRNVEYVLQYSNVTPFTWHKGRYRCFYCSEPMKEPELLREHTAKVHQFANLELVVYDRTRYNRNREAAVKIDVTGISCKLCSKPVKDLEQLIHHLIIAHDAEYDVSVPNCLLPFKLDRDQLACSICDMKFVFFEYLLRHANKLHLSHDYICDVCGTSFQGENHLKMHHRYYHREGGYPCDHCGITLATLSKKILHEKNIHMVNLSTCPHCPETFKSPYFKKLHLANVHGVEELRFKCPQCPRVFPQESIMSRHMRRVHLREKNVECEICGDRFFGPYDVKLHMMKHNGDKKFVCAVCGKKFSKKTNLNTHSATHIAINEGKRQFTCHVCGKIFVHKPNLKMHYRTAHPEFGDNVDLDQSAGISDLDTEIVHIDFAQHAHLTAEYMH